MPIRIINGIPVQVPSFELGPEPGVDPTEPEIGPTSPEFVPEVAVERGTTPALPNEEVRQFLAKLALSQLGEAK